MMNNFISKAVTYYWAICGVVITIGLVMFLITNLARFIENLNVEQKKMVGGVTETSQHEFLRFACKSKTVCKKYPDVKQGCAAAGNIQKCIDIRMKGKDSSMCLDDGEVVGFDDKTLPSFAQCTAFQVSEFFRTK
jgi:hypothetical protein